MASIYVDEIDRETLRLLRSRAALHGVSLEEEVRRILARAAAAPKRLGTFAVECFGSTHGVDLELPPREPHDPPTFE